MIDRFDEYETWMDKIEYLRNFYKNILNIEEKTNILYDDVISMYFESPFPNRNPFHIQLGLCSGKYNDSTEMFFNDFCKFILSNKTYTEDEILTIINTCYGVDGFNSRYNRIKKGYYKPLYKLESSFSITNDRELSNELGTYNGEVRYSRYINMHLSNILGDKYKTTVQMTGMGRSVRIYLSIIVMV